MSVKVAKGRRAAILDVVTSSEEPGQGASGRWRGFVHAVGEALNPEIRWMRLPEGRRRLSRVHRSQDLVLKHFHEPLDLVALELVAGPRTDELLRQGIREVGPVDRRTDESKLNVWLAVRTPRPAADVMIGSAQLGSTTVPPYAWDALIREAERGLHADGVLEVAPDRDTGEAVVRRLRCWLPRESVGYL